MVDISYVSINQELTNLQFQCSGEILSGYLNGYLNGYLSGYLQSYQIMYLVMVLSVYHVVLDRYNIYRATIRVFGWLY